MSDRDEKKHIPGPQATREKKLWNDAIEAALDAISKSGSASYKRWKDEPDWRQPYAANRIYTVASDAFEAVRGLLR